MHVFQKVQNNLAHFLAYRHAYVIIKPISPPKNSESI